MELSSSSRTFTCYTAPGEVFESEEEMKEHYRSEWHRQNLKRKVAGLPPLTREAFEERQAREAAAPSAPLDAPPGASRSTMRRLKREAKQQEKIQRQSAHPSSKAAYYEATKNMTDEDMMDYPLAGSLLAFDAPVKGFEQTRVRL